MIEIGQNLQEVLGFLIFCTTVMMLVGLKIWVSHRYTDECTCHQEDEGS